MLLNLDAGERDDETEELWRQFDLLAIACGGHAGDAASMARVLGACARHGLRAGAHPSYPDREGFGRRTLAIDPAALAASIEAQCAALRDVALALNVPAIAANRLETLEAALGVGTNVVTNASDALDGKPNTITIDYVKPHGALYHDAARDPSLADAVLRGAAVLGSPTVIGPPVGALRDAALARGWRYLREGFADRGTRSDGTLIPRGQPGALIEDPATAALLARSLLDVDTICVHADTPNALAIARAVREALQ